MLALYCAVRLLRHVRKLPEPRRPSTPDEVSAIMFTRAGLDLQLASLQLGSDQPRVPSAEPHTAENRRVVPHDPSEPACRARPPAELMLPRCSHIELRLAGSAVQYEMNVSASRAGGDGVKCVGMLNRSESSSVSPLGMRMTSGRVHAWAGRPCVRGGHQERC